MGGLPVKGRRWGSYEVERAKDMVYRQHKTVEEVARVLFRTVKSVDRKLYEERMAPEVRRHRGEIAVIRRRNERLVARIARNRVKRPPTNEPPASLWQARCPAFRPSPRASQEGGP